MIIGIGELSERLNSECERMNVGEIDSRRKECNSSPEKEGRKKKEERWQHSLSKRRRRRREEEREGEEEQADS